MNRLNSLACLALAIAVVLVPTNAAAVDQQRAEAQRDKLRQMDGQIRDVKRDALSLSIAIAALEDRILYPDGNVLQVYLSVDMRAFVVETAQVLIGGTPSGAHEYTFNDAVALTRGGAHEVVRTGVPAGVHTVTLEIAGRYAEDSDTAPLIRRSQTQTINVSGAPRALEFVVQWSGRRSEPRLTAREWAGDRMAIPDQQVTDRGAEATAAPNALQARAARYLIETDRLFTAVTRLQAQSAGAEDRAPETLLAEAEALTGLGLDDEAASRYAQVSVSDSESRNAAVLQLAKFAYSRGYDAEAERRLATDLIEPLSQEHRLAAQHLLARTRMRANDFVGALSAFEDAGEPGDWPPIMQYNYAITLIRAERLERGLEMMRRVGRIDRPDFDRAALRDKANLALGYQLLKAERFEEAEDAFQRIRLNGQYANKGLLGFGWALYYGEETTNFDELPNAYSTLSTLMRPGGGASMFERLGIGLTDAQKTQRETAKRLERALVPWSELLTRDPMHPAVQEAFVAVPQALGSLGAHRQSLQYYLRAIELLEETRTRLNNAEEAVRSGRMIETLIARDLDSEAGWLWEVRDLPNAPETYYLYSLIASTSFQEALKNYRDLRFLARRVDGWLRQLSAYGSRLAEAARPADPDETVARARAARKRLFDEVAPDLRLDENLTREQIDNDPALAARIIKRDLALALSNPPAALAGTGNTPPAAQRVQEQRPTLFALRDRIEVLISEQRRLLESMAITELDGQREQAEEFLIEARFSVARIFDRTEAANAP